MKVFFLDAQNSNNVERFPSTKSRRFCWTEITYSAFHIFEKLNVILISENYTFAIYSIMVVIFMYMDLNGQPNITLLNAVLTFIMCLNRLIKK